MRRYNAINGVSIICLLLCVPQTQAENYAVLISAGITTADDTPVNSEFWYDMLLQYMALIDENYTHDTIYVLYGNGAGWNSSHTCYQNPYGQNIVDYSVTRANIQSVFATLSGIVTANDTLYVWWMGHGSPDGSRLVMSIDHTTEYVYDNEFAAWVDQVTEYDIRGFSFMTCHSGGILDDLEGPRSIVMSSATFYESTASDWLCDTYHAEFHNPETGAWHWQTPCGICGAIDADTSGDGQVSYLEAFNYADANTTYSNPQISDIGGLAADTFLGGDPLLRIAFPNGVPDLIPPGQATDIAVRISEGTEQYVPDSATLYYRYDGGSYQTSPLVSQGGESYLATLPPAGCDDSPEFYFSAEGTISGVVYKPTGAPADTYQAFVGQISTVFAERLDTDPGWTTEGQWAYGQPTGGGGQYGGPDPTSGYTGPNVYGFNLNGDYPNNLQERHLTSTAIDCTGLESVHLRFWRWLGVEQPSYDHAYIRVSNNGTNWTTVWENNTEIADESWTQMEVDISAVADDQPTVYLRWTMGTSDTSWQYCGWNIDDIELTAFTCESEFQSGDLNCDGAVNGFDIDPFVLVVGDDLAAYYALYPDCDHMLADVNGDGEVNGFDIDPFVALVGG